MEKPRIIAPADISRHAPQRIVRYAEVCDRCHGVDTFRFFARVRGVVYVKCSQCGRNATRQTIQKNAV